MNTPAMNVNHGSLKAFSNTGTQEVPRTGQFREPKRGGSFRSFADVLKGVPA